MSESTRKFIVGALYFLAAVCAGLTIAFNPLVGFIVFGCGVILIMWLWKDGVPND